MDSSIYLDFFSFVNYSQFITSHYDHNQLPAAACLSCGHPIGTIMTLLVFQKPLQIDFSSKKTWVCKFSWFHVDKWAFLNIFVKIPHHMGAPGWWAAMWTPHRYYKGTSGVSETTLDRFLVQKNVGMQIFVFL